MIGFEEYKIFLTIEIDKLKNEIINIDKKISALKEGVIPTIQNRNIQKELFQIYCDEKSIKGLKKIFINKKQAIGELLLLNELNSLTKQKQIALKKIEELTKTINSIKDSKLISQLESNTYTIQYLFIYGINQNKDVELVYRMLLEIMKNTSFSDTTESDIRKNILSMYDKGEIRKGINIRALLFFYDKYLSLHSEEYCHQFVQQKFDIMEFIRINYNADSKNNINSYRLYKCRQENA